MFPSGPVTQRFHEAGLIGEVELLRQRHLVEIRIYHENLFADLTKTLAQHHREGRLACPRSGACNQYSSAAVTI